MSIQLPSDEDATASMSHSTTPILPIPTTSPPPTPSLSLRKFIDLHETLVPHVRQSYSWDCGLACVEMALRARGLKRVSLWDLRKKCTTYRVWSIDIAYLLHSYQVETTFYTTQRGVRSDYLKQGFYKKHILIDRPRVTRLFANAEQAGVVVVERRVEMEQIKNALLNQTLIVLLVDKRMLKCCLCHKKNMFWYKNFFQKCPGYLGHYVLVYAYHPGHDKFLIKDSSTLTETCVLDSQTLEEARVAFGTDQDILFIGDYKRPLESS